MKAVSTINIGFISLLKHVSLVCALASSSAVAGTMYSWSAEPLIWVEAEQAVKTQLVDNAGLNAVNPDELSGGKWICSFSHEKDPSGMGEYALDITTAGRFRLSGAGRARHGPGLSPG